MDSRLTLIKELGLRQFKGCKRNMGLYKCSCGKEKEMTITSVNRDEKPVLSCGCLTMEANYNKFKHGMRGTRIYGIWGNMKYRCTSVSCKEFKYYGAKGIKVCDRWNDFMNFWEDNKENYRDDLTIDRIDSKGNYEPSNCRWITNSENASRANKEYSITEDGNIICKRGHINMFHTYKNGLQCRKCRNLTTWISFCKRRIYKNTRLELNSLKLSINY